MNTNEALKVLNLKPGISLEDAKKAYRALAKQHHPDVSGKNPDTQQNAEARMKEINLAFRSLAPELKPKKEIEAEPRPENKESQGKKKNWESKKNQKKHGGTEKKEKKAASFSWSAMFEDLGHFFERKPVQKGYDRKFRSKRTPPLKKRPKKDSRNFEEILETIDPDRVLKKKKRVVRGDRKKREKSTLYSGYQRYMALKRKMRKARVGRSQDMRVGRIQRIQPVNPVERIKK